MNIPTQSIEQGFYYHYKHDPVVGITHMCYEVVGVGISTEDECDPKFAHVVVYRPLYADSSVYTAGKLYWIRPIHMWGNVTKDGKTFPRFKKINEPELVEKLTRVRHEMYGA